MTIKEQREGGKTGAERWRGLTLSINMVWTSSSRVSAVLENFEAVSFWMSSLK
jgi:Tfp pilus assembly protein PilN